MKYAFIWCQTPINYLQAFRYGLPPHGGCSTGLERITARMLEVPNVKEASAFPRDMSRIDTRISD